MLSTLILHSFDVGGAQNGSAAAPKYYIGRENPAIKKREHAKIK